MEETKQFDPLTPEQAETQISEMLRGKVTKEVAQILYAALQRANAIGRQSVAEASRSVDGVGGASRKQRRGRAEGCQIMYQTFLPAINACLQIYADEQGQQQPAQSESQPEPSIILTGIDK